MSNNLKHDAPAVNHPANEGVQMRHFYGKDETDGCLNNLEISIAAGAKIAEHVHDNASEFFYCISGEGEFLNDTNWLPVRPGDAFRAPKGMVHAVVNSGSKPLLLFSTFCPPIR